MLARRLFLLVAGFACLAGLASAAAPGGRAQPFTPVAFAAAKLAGKPILIDVTASWCPVCKIQRVVLGPLLAQPRFNDILVLEIDFDQQKDALRLVNARIQSTLIVYRGDDEMGRSLGDTNPESLESLLTMAL